MLLQNLGLKMMVSLHFYDGAVKEHVQPREKLLRLPLDKIRNELQENASPCKVQGSKERLAVSVPTPCWNRDFFDHAGHSLFMKVYLPGFPTEVSEPIELPDIGELLMYPAFQGIVADDFLKYATEFQRHLFNKVPIKNDRKSVIVRSGVWLLESGTRSHVKNTGDWHFDGESDYAHIRPDERIFILSSPCSALTEFNVNPLEIESAPDETRRDLGGRISRSPEEFGIVGRAIEPGRIYSFENHLHRAVDPKRIEFRFFFRVRETDKPGFLTTPVKRLFLNVNGMEQPHIDYGPEKLSIYFPHSLRPGIY